MLLKEVQLSSALDDCQQLKDNYAHMLEFIGSGGRDDNSERMRGQMLATSLRLLLVAERAFRLQHDEGLYTTTYNRLCEQDCSLQVLTDNYLEAEPATKERETMLDSLFNIIWTSAPLTDKDGDCVRQLIEQSTTTEQCTLVSALTLSLQEYVDDRKLMLLVNELGNVQPSVKVRALTGIVLCILRHPEDIMLLSDSVQLIRTILEQDTEVQTIVASLNLAFLICLQTQSAREKMEKEILPEFMKIAKDGRIELGFNEDGDLHIDLPEEENKQPNGIRSKVMQFIDMQRDGIDLNASNMLSTRNLPFFQELAHWFLPFDKERTEIRECLGDKIDQLDFLGNMTSIVGHGDCDTDRYATVMFVMKHMGKEIRDNLLAMMQMKSEDGSEGQMLPDLSKLGRMISDDTRDLCRKYLQQLYRVFTMSPHCKEWTNPFLFSTNWLRNPILSLALANNNESLHLLTDFLIKYKNYKAAEAYLNRLVQLEGSDADTLRSAAYCKQQQGHFGSALTLYTQADILAPEHSWTLAQMQFCYAQLDKHEQRLDCLLQLEQLEPDNAKVVAETGLCLMQLQRWQDAAQRFFKLELEGRRVAPSWRAIAWCALHQGKHEQALKYYHKLFDSPNARWQDYLRAGHAAWVQGDTKEAIELYRNYIRRYLTDDPKITDSLTPFNEDNALLLSLGKTQHEIDIMHDILER